jgi:hypothetical protein
MVENLDPRTARPRRSPGRRMFGTQRMGLQRIVTVTRITGIMRRTSVTVSG